MHGMVSPTASVRPAPPNRDIPDDHALAWHIARIIIRARTAAGLSQAELATRMSTAQSFVARLESGRALPSTTTLVKVARATATVLRVELVGPSGPMGCDKADPSSP